MEIQEKIKKAVASTAGLKASEIYLETPEREEHGDYSSNVAMQLFSQNKEQRTKNKIKHSSPRDLAQEIVEKLKKDKELQEIAEKIEVAGPGFINFHLTRVILVKEIKKVIQKRGDYRKTDTLGGKKIMVEYAHPNTHKEFHIGHLRNIVLAESINRLLEHVGAKVVRANYQGDVGLHIAKALWGIKKLVFKDPEDVKKRVKFLGQAYVTGSKAYDDSEEVKEKIKEINNKIYSQDDGEINELYKETRQWSLDYFESIYKRVYTKFDRLYFESECFESGKKYSYEALEKGILKRSDGAIIFPGSEYGLHDRVFVTKEDVPTYEAKDFGLIRLQIKEYNPDLVMHVLGPEQLSYTAVIFKAQELLFPETKGKQLHVPYGWVRLKKGKMSSRTGKVVLGEQLLDDAKKEIKNQFKSNDVTAEQIAIGAVKYSFLKVSREQDIAFDLKESVSLEGNSGPYIQYTFARTQSVLRKALGNNQLGNSEKEKLIPSAQSLVPNDEELALLRTFIQFPEVIATAAGNYAPNLICNYLHDLAQKFNTFYQKCDILEERTKDKELSQLRLALTFATGQILKNGLNLLGIKTPERM